MTKRRARGKPISPRGKCKMRSAGTANSPKRLERTEIVSGSAAAAIRAFAAAPSATLAIGICLPHRSGVGEPVVIRQLRLAILSLDGEEDLLAKDAHVGGRRK